MTLIAPERASAESPPQAEVWTEVETGFWAGNRPGEFLGTIEEHRQGFAAFDALHQPLGVFTTLVEAQKRIARPDTH
ncbi:hypothetical protein AB3K78_16310 [Leucobacter sp. HNU]|uniref:hypothetical protein n=1 Tax=Leucobacter sp. HNU TaxID=3236805 RepID=UPI003A800B95